MRNIVIIFLIFTALFAQSNQEFILKDVNVEGNVVSTANTIIFTSGLRKGAKVSSAEFPRAIKRLWQLGLFDDVQIKYDEETGNKLSITIVVLESNILGDVKYNGNKKIKLSADKLLLSVGIKPNVEDLGLESLNIKMEKGFIKTNEYMQTSENGIYAIGDVTDGPWLAHKASHEGILCVDAIKGLKTHKIQKENIPGCTYSRPQIASIGLTENRALELNHEIKVGRFPFIGNGKAIAYAIWKLQDRGTMFVKHQTPVYQGMVVGEHSRDNDLEINVLKGKQLTNVRASGSDEASSEPDALTLVNCLPFKTFISRSLSLLCSPTTIP